MRKSPPIPTQEDTREVFVLETDDAQTVLVLVGHDGRETSVPVPMRNTQPSRVAA